MQSSLVRELKISELKLDVKTVEAAKNICCAADYSAEYSTIW